MFQTLLARMVHEYHANVIMSVDLPLGKHTYSLHGGYASTPDHAVQLAAVAGLTIIRHQESTMQENRAFQYYPTMSTTPRRIRFPLVRSDDDVTMVYMSRYMVTEYVPIAELVRDATCARQTLPHSVSLKVAEYGLSSVNLSASSFALQQPAIQP